MKRDAPGDFDGCWIALWSEPTETGFCQIQLGKSARDDAMRSGRAFQPVLRIRVVESHEVPILIELDPKRKRFTVTRPLAHRQLEIYRVNVVPRARIRTVG